MKIPNKVKIGGYLYSVERPEKEFVSGNSVCDGTHDFSNQEIRVAKTGTKAYQDTVFYMRYATALLLTTVAIAAVSMKNALLKRFQKACIR